VFSKSKPVLKIKTNLWNCILGLTKTQKGVLTPVANFATGVVDTGGEP
jgi:hypothetical protein